MQAGQQRPLAHEGAIHVASGPVQAEMAVDRGITIGQVALQGPREEMEDELVTESHSPSGFMYAAIFDDHVGFSSAQFLRDELYKECVTALEGGALLESQDLSEAETAVTCAFLQADKRLLSWYALGCLMYSVCGIKHNW
jgi:protein phosphatase 1A